MKSHCRAHWTGKACWGGKQMSHVTLLLCCRYRPKLLAPHTCKSSPSPAADSDMISWYSTGPCSCSVPSTEFSCR